MDNGFEITVDRKSTEFNKLSSVPFDKIKREILGNRFDLSLVFITPKKSLELNKNYRNKNYPANILSFKLDKTVGEIFITHSLVKKEAKIFNKTYKEFVAYLFIHGCLHLKGMEHGSKMTLAENKFCKKFGL